MKKLNLKLGGLKEMLTREQMKKVVGGYGDECKNECTTNSDCSSGYTCGLVACGGQTKFKMCI